MDLQFCSLSDLTLAPPNVCPMKPIASPPIVMLAEKPQIKVRLGSAAGDREYMVDVESDLWRAPAAYLTLLVRANSDH
jgi:hypothetical protein